MNDQPALPSPTATAAADRSNLVVIVATLVILVALGAGGYFLRQELDRMANAKPQAPPELTQALTQLRTQLDQQRANSATQLNTLQNEIATMKEQQAAQETPDVDAAIAPVQEKLDELIQHIQEAPPPVAQLAPEATPEIAAPNSSDPLRDYLGLRRKVESGQPYAAELAAMIPQLPDSELAAITTLQAQAEQGLGTEDEEVDASKSDLKPWMHAVNEKLKGLVSIKPSAGVQTTPQARAEVMAALDRIEASLMGGQ